MMDSYFGLRITFVALLLIGVASLIEGKVEIDRSHQDLSWLPTDIPDNVTHLLLKHNMLSELPAGGFGSLEQLKYLNLEHNSLVSAGIDRDCLKGTVVSTLKLEHNKLSTLPQLVQSHLTVLYMQHNVIRQIGNASMNGLPDLKHLYLGMNQISYIHPDAFCGTLLQTIGLSSNTITTVPDFHCLENTLRSIHLFGNKICIVSNADFANLHALRILQLGHNCLQQISGLDINVGQHLEVLRLYGNSLEVLDINWSYFRSLQVVNLADNNFRCFHLVRGFGLYSLSLLHTITFSLYLVHAKVAGQVIQGLKSKCIFIIVFSFEH